MLGTSSTFGSPIGYSGQQTGWGLSPYGMQGLGTYLSQQNPQQVLTVVSQQIQQLQYLQQQHVQLLQQLVQAVPQQLHQLQQVLQIVPQQLQQLQQAIQFLPQQLQQFQGQQIPFGQPAAGLGGIGIGQPFLGTSPYGSQGFPGHVM